MLLQYIRDDSKENVGIARNRNEAVELIMQRQREKFIYPINLKSFEFKWGAEVQCKLANGAPKECKYRLTSE